MKHWRSIVLLAVVAVGLVVLFARRDPQLGSTAPLPRRSKTVDGRVELEQTTPQSESIGLDQPSAGSERAEVEEAELFGRVLDGKGNPVAGATVSWSATVASHAEGTIADLLDTNALRSSTRWSTTGAQGSFTFHVSPEIPDADSVIWVTHPNYVASYQRLLRTNKSVRSGLRFVLVPAEERSARVTASGVPVAGARVLQRAVPSLHGEDREVRATFVREFVTGHSGACALATLEGQERITATDGTRISEALEGLSEGDVQIELADSITAEGLVVLQDGSSIPPEARVLCEVRSKERWICQTTTEVRPDATWGPVSFGAKDDRTLRFSVEGGGLVRATAIVERPLSSLVRVDIPTVPGVDQWFVATDAVSGEPIVNSTLEVHWQEESGDWSILHCDPRDDGYYLVRGCKPGTISYLFRAPGYAFGRGGPRVIPTVEPVTFRVNLQRAGRLEGRCLNNGVPVPDFKVMYWPTGKPQQLWNEAFEGRGDGTFLLEEVAAGDLTVVAHGPGLGQSELVTVGVPAGGVGEVELEVSAARTARGNVVDQISGEPVPGATVQLFVAEGLLPIYPTGDPVTADSDGRFEVSGISNIPTVLEVSAPGYAFELFTTPRGSSKGVELGSLEISRSQPLELRLHYPEGADPTQYTVETNSAGLTATSFDSEGIVFAEDFTAAVYSFRVNLPNGETGDHLVDLVPGRDWVVDLHHDGACSLTVEVSGLQPRERFWIHVRYGESLHYLNWNAPVPDSGVVLMHHLHAGSAHVEVGVSSDIVMTKPVQLIPGEMAMVQLDVAKERRRFRIVDTDSRPVASTEVRFAVDGSEAAGLGGSAGADGEFLCAVPESEALTAHMIHPTLGMATDVAVQLARDENEVTEIEFDAGESLSAILLDQGNPVNGVVCRLGNGVWQIAIGSVRSDATGVVTWDRVGAGDYDFLADHPNYWPVRASLSANDGQPPQEIPLRRRGDLRLRIQDVNGSAVEGATARLRSLDLGSDVADWVQSGLVHVSPGGAMSDAEGEIVWKGLPRGAIEWSVAAPMGEVSGTASVPGGAEETVDVVVQ